MFVFQKIKKIKSDSITTINKYNNNVTTPTTKFFFYRIQKRNLYYETTGFASDKNSNTKKTNNNLTRNIDFVFNLGYNSLSEFVENNIPITKTVSLIRNKKLINHIKNHYIDLLEAIEFGDVKVFDEILEKNLKYVLYNDIIKYSKNKYSFKILHKDAPIEIRFLAFNELYNIEIEREKNLITQDYVIAPFAKNKFILANENTYKLKDTKTVFEIDTERKSFENSDFKVIAWNHFQNGLKDQFKVEYLKLKLKPNASDEDLHYLIGLMNSLERIEFKTDQYCTHIKNEFGDYYTLRDKYLKEQKAKVDLYLHFKANMPSQYKTFFEKNSNKSMLRNMLVGLKRMWFDKVINPRKYAFGKKSVQVIDVEISSKMRIEIYDENGENILQSKFHYEEHFKTNNVNKKEDKQEGGEQNASEYDKNYVFSIPRFKWDLSDEDYVQKHLLRIEFEKLNKKLFTSRNVYKSMRITDIDLALKGNRHYRLVKK